VVALFHSGCGDTLKTLTISKQAVLLIVMIVLMTSAGIILIQRYAPKLTTQTPTQSPDTLASEKAAVDGTQAFFQIQVSEGKDTWLSRFCSLSTESGCAFLRAGADRLWQRYAEAKMSVQAQVTALEMVKRSSTEQVWKVDVELSSPLPGSNRTKDEAYALVVKSEPGWKFDRFLLEPEIQAIATRNYEENK
jgi:hypothetical protein